MLIHQKYNMKQFLLVLGSLTLLLLLTACSTGGNTGSASTATPTSKPTLTPGGTVVYNGDGYTLTYPQDWKLTTHNTAGDAIIDIVPPGGDQNTTFSIAVTATVPAVPGLDGAITNALISFKNHFSNYQQDTSVASSVTIDGDTWKEAGATGTTQGTQVKNVIIVDQHPASTGKIFAINLIAPARSYDQINTSTFQSILQSFKFSPTNAQKY